MLFSWQRRGVVDGIDYGYTGEVKKVDVSRMRERLDGGCIVLLSNLGYSSSGEVLNCKYVLVLPIIPFYWANKRGLNVTLFWKSEL